MADLQKEKILFAMTEEVTQGTPETLAAADFIELTEDGATVNGPREMVETNPLSGDRLKKKSRKTIQNGDGSGVVYLRAGEAAGDTPELDLVLRSQGWSKEQVATKTTTTTSNTTTVLNIASGDELKYKVGQGILVDGKHKNIISALADGEITVLVPFDVAPADGVEIEKLCAYRLDDASDVSFTARKFYSGEVKQEVPGCKVSEISSADMVAGSVPKINFTFQGLNFAETLEELGVTPNFNDAEFPASIEACLYKDGVKIEANEFSFTASQTLTMKKTLCAANVNKSIRGTGKYNISGSMNIYKKDDQVDFPINDTKFDLFISFHVPAGSNGEKSGVICLYFSDVKVNERDTNGDIDGLVSTNVTWACEPTSDSSSYPVITFI